MYAHMLSFLIVVLMGTHLAHVVYMHHLNQKMRINPDDMKYSMSSFGEGIVNVDGVAGYEGWGVEEGR